MKDAGTAANKVQRVLAFLERFRDVPAAAWGISTGAVTVYAAYYAIAVPDWPVSIAIGLLGAVVFVSVLASGAYALARPSQSERILGARRDYDAGCLAFEDKRYSAAITLFQRAAEDDKCYLHLSKYGRACIRLGRYEEAIAALTKCHDLAPTTSMRHTARRNRGVAFMITQQWGAALSDFDEYIAANKRDSVIRRARALVHLARGETREALTDARDAARIAPTHSAPRATLAVVLSASGDEAGARKNLDKANQLSPETPNALFAVAQANAALGNLDEAYRRLETTVQTDSRFAPRSWLDPILSPLRADEGRFRAAVEVTEWKLLGDLGEEG